MMAKVNKIDDVETLVKITKAIKTVKDSSEILRLAVTCNHIHLLAVDSSSDVISKSIQLVPGATGKSYNSRKNRKGAFYQAKIPFSGPMILKMLFLPSKSAV